MYLYCYIIMLLCNYHWFSNVIITVINVDDVINYVFRCVEDLVLTLFNELQYMILINVDVINVNEFDNVDNVYDDNNINNNGNNGIKV